MPTLGTEGNWNREGLVSLADSSRSLRNIIIKAASGVLPSLRMLGAITPAGTSAAKSGGNTGNGTMGTVTVAADTPSGVYTLRITAAAANAGTFVVKDPAGRTVATGTVAVAFAGGGLSFTLADGSTDFIVGDGFDITVTATKYDNYDDAASDGTQSARGLLLDEVDASGTADQLGVLIVREASVLDRFVTAEVSGHKQAGKTDLANITFLY